MVDSTRPSIDRRSVLAALAVGAGATALPAVARSAASPLVRNAVLVHGAYADGSCWTDVIGILQERGWNVTAVQHPLTTIEAGAEATARALSLQPGPSVLVGHSFGGTIISQSGARPDVAALVYVAARAPDAAEDYTALAATYPPAPASAGLVKAGGYAKLGEEAFLRDFANGVPTRRARTLYATQAPIADGLFKDRTSIAAWREKASWYAVSAEDRTINPDLERFMAKRMNASTIEVPAGHLSMISHPDRIAGLIEAAGRGRPDSRR